MEPHIQYAQTTDGVSIAYAEAGEGTPVLIVSPAGFTHVELGWDAPVVRGLASRFRAVWFDHRGTGLSDRSATDFSLDAAVRDMEAVVEEANLGQFVVAGMGIGSMAAIAYVAAHPERVSHLILCDGCARYSDFGETAVVRAGMPLLEIDWQLYTEMFGHVMWAYANPDFGRWFGELMRLACDQETHRAIWKAWVHYDVTPSLSAVAVPTLVVRNKGNRLFPAPEAQRIAASIRGARFTTIDDTTYSLVPEMIETFVTGSVAVPASEQALRTPASGTTTVLFTDLVGHTEMMQRLGDAKGRDVLREHERITREVLKAHDGTEIKTDGDSFMISFGSATRAVECSIAIQRAFAEREGEPLSVRVGLNAGEPIEEDGDLFGATVILASRIAAKAGAGEILVADTVRGLCSGKGFVFGDRGEFVAKGFEEPVRVYEVNWRA